MVSVGLSQRLVVVLSHEIGHILGARHDADENKNSPCYKENGRVMNAEVNRGSPHRFQFSPCSSNYFYNLRQIEDNCLKDGNGTVTGQRLGELVKADEICARAYMRGGFVARLYYHGRPSYANICKNVNCVNKYGFFRRTVTALQGSKCGKVKNECD